MRNIEEHIKKFHKILQNAKFVETKKDQSVTRMKKINSQFNERYNMKSINIGKYDSKAIDIKIFKDLIRSYVELDTRLKTMKENLNFFPRKDSENNIKFYRQKLFESTQKKYITNKTDV